VPVDNSLAVNVLGWRHDTESVYLAMAAVARHFVRVPATWYCQRGSFQHPGIVS